MNLSRREFLKLSSLAFGAALLPPIPLEEGPRQAIQLGRPIYLNNVYDRPSLSARKIGIIPAESIFNIFATVQSDDNYYNRTWYETDRGYVHSASIQPVRWQLNQPMKKVLDDGFLGEITVPYSLARTGPSGHYNTANYFFYSTTYWITESETDDDGAIWYGSLDDRSQKTYWIQAEHVRRVTAAEMTPISPGVADKRIEVSLEKQTFTCFENGQVVMTTLCSTGPYLRTENGKRIFGTPTGDWFVMRKRPTRHMAGDDFAADDFFDLPGVPWVSYFHWWGVSIHGTYWHNDYGRPRSHGCVNLRPEDAKWVFRWTTPRASIYTPETKADGTPVIVTL
jgi:hypothetical protein